MIKFENMEHKLERIQAFLNGYGISGLEESAAICSAAHVDAMSTVKGIQPISFDDAGWAYTVACAAALRSSATTAREVALVMGEGLQAVCL